MDKHPDLSLLSSFGRGSLSRRQSREIVRHLLARCESCCRTLAARALPPLGVRRDRGERSVDYAAAFTRSWRETDRQLTALAAERAEAPELLRELLAQPAGRRTHLATASARYHTWALCELLLDAAGELGFQDPSRALDAARLGVEVAGLLAAAVYGEERVNDLRARAWAVLGNAQRIRADFRPADEDFVRAERLLRKGTGDPLEKAQLLLLKASLRGNQQRFREAFRLLDRVLAIGGKLADERLRGKALIMKGFQLGVAGHPEAAIRHLAAGLCTVDAKSDQRLFMSAQHNLALYLTESGRHEEAARLLESARPLYHEVGDRMSLLRLRWLEGKIAIALGRFGHAEETLRGVLKELVEHELGFDAAMLSLDLASIYAQQGRSAEMRRLAEEMIPLFQSRDIHREAIAALLVFHQAAQMESVTLNLIRDVSCAARGLRSRESR